MLDNFPCYWKGTYEINNCKNPMAEHHQWTLGPCVTRVPSQSLVVDSPIHKRKYKIQIEEGNAITTHARLQEDNI